MFYVCLVMTACCYVSTTTITTTTIIPMFCVENDTVDHTRHNFELTAILFSLFVATKPRTSQYVFILQVLNTLCIVVMTYFNKHGLIYFAEDV